MRRAQRTLSLEPEQAHPRARAPAIPEADVQKAVLKYLKLHKDVGWVERMNTGVMTASYTRKRDGVTKERFVRFAFKGCSDILGQLKDGRFLAVECKGTNGRPTEDQSAFLRRVRENGGVAGVAWSLADAERIMSDALGEDPF